MARDGTPAGQVAAERGAGCHAAGSRGGGAARREPRPPGSRAAARVTCGGWAGRTFRSAPAPSLPGRGAGKLERERGRRRLRPDSDKRRCMERPARLCGLWALLLSAGAGGRAARPGECSSPGPGRRPRGRRGCSREAAEGLRAAAGMGAGGCPHDAPRSAAAASRARIDRGTEERRVFSGFREAAVAALGQGADDLSLHFPCAFGKSQGTRRRGEVPKHARGVGGRQVRIRNVACEPRRGCGVGAGRDQGPDGDRAGNARQ